MRVGNTSTARVASSRTERAPDNSQPLASDPTERPVGSGVLARREVQRIADFVALVGDHHRRAALPELDDALSRAIAPLDVANSHGSPPTRPSSWSPNRRGEPRDTGPLSRRKARVSNATCRSPRPLVGRRRRLSGLSPLARSCWLLGSLPAKCQDRRDGPQDPRAPRQQCGRLQAVGRGRWRCRRRS